MIKSLRLGCGVQDGLASGVEGLWVCGLSFWMYDRLGYVVYS